MWKMIFKAWEEGGECTLGELIKMQPHQSGWVFSECGNFYRIPHFQGPLEYPTVPEGKVLIEAMGSGIIKLADRDMKVTPCKTEFGTKYRDK